jgi:hypothetical protein
MTAEQVPAQPGRSELGPVQLQPIRMLDDEPATGGSVGAQPDPGVLILTCANCGAPMDERKCKLICRCGYFLSCSDYY